ncbi:MAG TPA: winged helix-turn-helix domain-containing protein [Casimicrobiaceae bacterium]|nr:winged helix-turn-helix domain-containing protein [Casimicrobiaceae bacterium]
MQGYAKSTPAPRTRETISFGPFSLVASERLLTKDGEPVPLTARAFDILIALLSHPNEAIGKRDLMARVWPDVNVEESSLRFHVMSLRKALGDGKDGGRYIMTLPGRGYCFVAPLARASSPPERTAVAAANFSHANLPARLGRIVGRDDDVLKLSTQLNASRFVTIVGAGGVGKTTVAVAVAHHLMAVFAGSVLFVDFGMLSDPKLVPTVVASMLGLSVQSDDATPSLIAYLREKRTLLILDTCEHLIEAIAALAARIIEHASQVHILATSRETLRVEGEHAYRLDALACPPDGLGLTAVTVQEFPATQLFVERAVASGAQLIVSDVEAPIVADICRKLGGVALAIELTARRVDTYGLQQTAALLDQRLTLLWQGSRTAPPRQKTLQATLDWSYGLLSELERVVLRQLAVFVGHFTLDAALAVVTSAIVDQSHVFGAIDSLVAKSMVATRPIGAMVRYRLLDTTRAYALGIGIDDAEAADLAVRHATYYRLWLKQYGTEWPILATGVAQAPDFAAINNVRAALEWCFGTNGNVEIGVGLAAAAAPVFLGMSLLTECHRWSERAILALDEAARGGAEEMHLQAGLGISSMHMRGESDAALGALNRSLAIAEERCDVLHQVGLLGMLHVFHFRGGDFSAALRYAKRNRTLADTVEDPAALALAHSILGRSLYLMGELSGARLELEASLRHWPRSRQTTIYFAYDSHYRTGIALARTLWLQGYPAQAVERARQAIKSAAPMNHPASLAVVLASAASVFLWSGDLHSAEECTDSLISHAESRSLGPLLTVGRAFKAALAIRRGDTKDGVESLQDSLEKFRALRYELVTTEFELPLVEGLAASGRFAEGITLIDETIRRVDTNGDVLFMPELLRVKGGLLLSMPQPSVNDAEMYLTQSLELSRRQGARGWELRAATDLAALRASQGRSADARTLLLPVFDQFTEGADTADLKAAEELLGNLV